MITLDGISHFYGNNLLFTEASLLLKPKERYGLVGANGSGKSTLLRLICGTEEPCDGVIQKQNDLRIGWLRQDQFIADSVPIAQAVLFGFPELYKPIKRREELITEDIWDENRIAEICQIEETIAALDGYAWEGRVEKILIGLGIERSKHQDPLGSLSGGFRWRVLLAQVLFANPDLLVLDEPTNHLDLPSIVWLEKFLSTDFPGTILFTTHDERFMRGVATSIIDIDFYEIRTYSLKYDAYLEQKKLFVEQVDAHRKGLEEKKAQMQRFIDRFGAKASKAAQAGSRQKMIDKMEIPDLKKTTRVKPGFKFKQIRPCGKIVFEAQKISKSFGANHVLKNINLRLMRGEKCALIGANGRGKSTLLKVIIQDLTSDSGLVRDGTAVKRGYFAQDLIDRLPAKDTPISWLASQHEDMTTERIRSILGQVLIGADHAEQPLLKLSGGERVRVVLAHLMLLQPNFLILDEPTNHLDVESIQALIDALKAYEGALLVVSHNRDFLEEVVNQWIVVPEMKSFYEPSKAFEMTLTALA